MTERIRRHDDPQTEGSPVTTHRRSAAAVISAGEPTRSRPAARMAWPSTCRLGECVAPAELMVRQWRHNRRPAGFGSWALAYLPTHCRDATAEQPPEASPGRPWALLPTGGQSPTRPSPDHHPATARTS
ncbi:hypothetical protein ZWY2020_058303 [Hordeum vulgare]|nr:hypothetical protein ZWY2020_058303 [Hordeum vulgare]